MMKKLNDAAFTFRLPASLKKEAHERADARGEDLADVLRAALKRYVKRKP